MGTGNCTPCLVVRTGRDNHCSGPSGGPTPVVTCHRPVLRRCHTTSSSYVMASSCLGDLRRGFNRTSTLTGRTKFSTVSVGDYRNCLLTRLSSTCGHPNRCNKYFRGHFHLLGGNVHTTGIRRSRDFVIATHINVCSNCTCP